MKSLEYDPNTILPSDITLLTSDATLKELEYRPSTVHAMADVLERACDGEAPPCPQTIAVVLRLLRECFLESALGDIRRDRRCLRILVERRAN
jgi:hypothetical protein